MKRLKTGRQIITAPEWQKLAAQDPNLSTDGLVLRKAYLPEEIKAPDGMPDGSRQLQFVISTGSIDRDRDTVEVAGWKLENYLRNPVVLWAHDYRGLPIGRAVSLDISGARLVSTAEFVTADQNPFGDMVYQLLLGKYLRATSVGFQPLTWVQNESRGGIDFKEQELLEYSVCPVPANPEALQLAIKGGIDLAPLSGWTEQLLDEQSEDAPVSRSAAAGVQKLLSGDKTYWVLGDPEIKLEDQLLELADQTLTEDGEPIELEDASSADPEPDAAATREATVIPPPPVAVLSVEVSGAWIRVLGEDLEVRLEVNGVWTLVLRETVPGLGKLGQVNRQFGPATLRDLPAGSVWEEKRGRVISAANEARVRKAMGGCEDARNHLDAVLSSLTDENSLPEPDGESFFELADSEPATTKGIGEEPDTLDFDSDSFRSMLRGELSSLIDPAVRSAINGARGRLD